MTELTTSEIYYDSEPNSKEAWRRYSVTLDNDIVVFVYCPQNIRPTELNCEFIDAEA